VTGARLLDLINAQRSLKVLLVQLTDDDEQVDSRRLQWSDSPAGLGWPHDGERVLALFIKAAGGTPNRPVSSKAVASLLDGTLDAIVEANRALLYDDVVDPVELDVADLDAPLPLAHALASLVPVVEALRPTRPLIASLPTVAQVRQAERWLLTLLERMAPDAPLTFGALVDLATDSGSEPLGLSGWSRTLPVIAALRDHDTLETAPHLVRQAAQWWAGQSTFDPFPEANGNGVADEVGALQRVFDTFAELARSFEPRDAGRRP
jgi:hypothetical protein